MSRRQHKKRYLAQRRKGAEKKRRREVEKKPTGDIEQCAFFLLRVRCGARASSYLPSARAFSCRIATGFDIMSRSHPEPIMGPADTALVDWVNATWQQLLPLRFGEAELICKRLLHIGGLDAVRMLSEQAQQGLDELIEAWD